MARRQKKKRQIKYFDYSLLFIIIFLICFGLVMLYSTSAYDAQLTFKDPTHYLRRQGMAFGLGLVGMFVISRIDYRYWKKLGGLAYLVAIVLCTLVLIPGIGIEHNYSRRWLGIPNSSLEFQPSEFAKLAVIMFLASVICRFPKKMGKFSTVVKIMLFILPLFALIAYNNLSTAIIVMGIGVAMIFVASPKYLQFILIGLTGVGGIALFLVLPSAGYRSERIQMWRHPENFAKGYQTLQGLYAIGSGGLFGKGLGNSMQKLGFVPEAPNDMIFSIICEELGLFGAICVILLFLLLIWRFMVIANNARDLFGALLVTGILAHIAIQVVLNIAVVTNSIPNTGVTLPFISYGGTSVVFLMAEMGLALSVSRGIQFEPDASEMTYD
ncbi:MAG: putative lipid II flippase FtsW [Lachnospiraceae bacterium]|nr:putative lipid II flippase FtsW [Lachnospiraceae bacterium]MDD7176670.1 putative peptidoglycan glycosyltransferase FtsW [bacterium]MDY5516840.1 putative peptidoglycan glycosyltransferase FtsW [Lachnospiraceae bacterium]